MSKKEMEKKSTSKVGIIVDGEESDLESGPYEEVTNESLNALKSNKKETDTVPSDFEDAVSGMKIMRELNLEMSKDQKEELLKSFPMREVVLLEEENDSRDIQEDEIVEMSYYDVRNSSSILSQIRKNSLDEEELERCLTKFGKERVIRSFPVDHQWSMWRTNDAKFMIELYDMTRDLMFGELISKLPEAMDQRKFSLSSMLVVFKQLNGREWKPFNNRNVDLEKDRIKVEDLCKNNGEFLPQLGVQSDKLRMEFEKFCVRQSQFHEFCEEVVKVINRSITMMLDSRECDKLIHKGMIFVNKIQEDLERTKLGSSLMSDVMEIVETENCRIHFSGRSRCENIIISLKPDRRCVLIGLSEHVDKRLRVVGFQSEKFCERVDQMILERTGEKVGILSSDSSSSNSIKSSFKSVDVQMTKGKSLADVYIRKNASGSWQMFVVTMMVLVVGAQAGVCNTQFSSAKPVNLPDCKSPYSGVFISTQGWNSSLGIFAPYEPNFPRIFMDRSNSVYCYDNATVTNNCTSSCTGPSTCNGDLEYCTSIACNILSSCYCTMSVPIEGRAYFFNGQVVRITGSASLVVGFDPDAFDEAVEEDSSIRISFVDPKVLINCDIKSVSVILSCGSESFNFVMNLTETQSFDVTSFCAKETSYEFSVTVSSGAQLVSETFEHIGTYSCVQSTCVLCKETFDNLNCLPLNLKITIICILVVSGIALCLMIPCLSLGFVYGLQFLKSFCCTCLTCCRCASKRIKNQMIRNEMNKTNNGKPGFLAGMWKWTEVDDETLSMVDQSKKETELRETIVKSEERNDKPSFTSGIGGYSSLRKNQTTYVFFAILLVSANLPKVLGACTSGITQRGTFENCVKSGDSVEKCTLKTQILASVPFPGSSFCFDISDERGKVVTDGEVTFDFLQERRSLTTQYFTSNWLLTGQSKKQCQFSGQCASCGTVPMPRAAFGEITNPQIFNLPGVTGCSNVCGCAACNCFFCGPACLFHAWSANPTGVVKTVSAIGSINRVIQMTMRIGNKTETKQISYGITGNLNMGNVSVVLQGSFAGQNVDFGLNQVIVGGGIARLGVTSPVNSPRAGLVGDIQSSSPVGLAAPTLSSFIFDPAMVVTVLQAETASFTSRTTGDFVLQSYPTFPLNVGGSVWNYNSQLNMLETRIPNPGGIVLTIDVKGLANVTRFENFVCPEINFVSGAGCFDCVEGVILKFTGKSTCLEGFATVEGIESSPSSIFLEKVEKEFEIKIDTNKNSGEGVVKFVSNGGTQDVNFNFKAIPNSLLVNDTFTQTVGTGVNVGGEFDSIQSFFDNFAQGTSSWWIYLIAAVIGVVGIILSVVVIKKVILPLNPLWRMKQMASKMMSSMKQNKEEMNDKKKTMEDYKSDYQQVSQPTKSDY